MCVLAIGDVCVSSLFLGASEAAEHSHIILKSYSARCGPYQSELLYPFRSQGADAEP